MSDAGTRILIVDDEVSFGEMVADILTDQGHSVVYLSDPREAVGRVGAERFDAALLDLVMPGMGGLELAERVKAASPDTEVLILTGQGDIESAIEGIHKGVFDYLQKGTIEVSRLERRVVEAVAKSRLTRENRELVARLRESNRLLKALQDIGTELAGEAFLDRILRRLVDSARELCGAERGRALLFDRTHGEDVLLIAAAAGDGAATVRGARLPLGAGIAPLVAETDQTLQLADPAQHPAYSHRSDELPAAHPGCVCAPLRHGTVYGALTVAGPAAGGFPPEAREVLDKLARQAAVAIENAVSQERSLNFFTHTCELLVSILDGMDVHYPGHSRMVAALSDMVTRRLGMSDADRRNVHFAGLLHDIGKIRLDPSLLRHEGQISEEHRRQIQQHPALGVELLRPISALEGILPIILAHHERWDGKGYPHGLAGEAIPVGARVVAVAEVFDAISRATPYSPQRSKEEALAELERCAGTQFDPRIVRLFVAEYRERGDQIRI